MSDAPPAVQKLLHDHQLLVEILKYLHERQSNNSRAQSDDVQVYADDEEQKQMKECHPRCIKVLEDFIGPILPRNLMRALDVAAGDGRLTAGFLFKSYLKVDLFD